MYIYYIPIRAAIADREKNRKSLVRGGVGDEGGGRGGGDNKSGASSGGGGSKMVSADSKIVSADSKMVSANFTGLLQQFYFTSSRNSFFYENKRNLKNS